MRSKEGIGEAVINYSKLYSDPSYHDYNLENYKVFFTILKRICLKIP